MGWTQENDRRDIRIESAVVPYIFCGSADTFSVTNEIAAKTVNSFIETAGLGLEVGDTLTITIPKTAVYRMSNTTRFLVTAGEGWYMGVGFTVGGVAVANLIAYSVKLFQGAVSNQHFMVHCYTEYKLEEGDSLSFVSFIDLPPSFLSASESQEHLCTLRPVLK